MADNVQITAGSGTTIAADDVSGVLYQVMKLDLGGDGASSPVSGSVPVSATSLDVRALTDTDVVTVTGGTGQTADVKVTLDSESVAVTASDLDIRDLTATDVVTVTGGAGQTADVKVTLDSESVAVTGTFWQTTQPVSGTVTVDAGTGPFPVSDNNGSLTVDGTVAVTTVKPDGTNTQPSMDAAARAAYVIQTDGTNTARTGDALARAVITQISDGTTVPVVRTAAQAGDNEADAMNRLEVCAHPMLFDGATWDRARGDSTDGMLVNLGANNDVVQATASNLNAQVVGVNTNDSPVTGNPLYIGGRAAATPQTNVSADGDFVPLRMDLHGCAFVQVHESLPAGSNTIGNVNNVEALADDAAFTVTSSKVMPAGFMADDTTPDSVDEGDVGVARMTLDRRQRVEIGNYTAAATASSTGSGNTSIVAAQGAGVSIYVTSLVGYNASTTDTYVNILDGSTTKLVVPLAAKGGFTMSFPAAFKISANAALQFACPGAVTTSYVSAVYYTAPG